MTLDEHGGAMDQVRHLNQSKQVLFDVIPAFSASDDSGEIEVAYQWTTGMDEEIHSIVNGTASLAGGMHVEGFKRALTRVVNDVTAHSRKEPSMGSLLGADVREGLTTVISVTVDNPLFGFGGKLENRELRSLVERTTRLEVSQWFAANPSKANAVVQKATAVRDARIDARRGRGQMPQ